MLSEARPRHMTPPPSYGVTRTLQNKIHNTTKFTAAEESLRRVPRARLLFQCLATALVRALLHLPLLVFDGLGHGGHFGLAHVLRVRVGWCDGGAHPRHL